jgi:hypothetical protein
MDAMLQLKTESGEGVLREMSGKGTDEVPVMPRATHGEPR